MDHLHFMRLSRIYLEGLIEPNTEFSMFVWLARANLLGDI